MGSLSHAQQFEAARSTVITYSQGTNFESVLPLNLCTMTQTRDHLHQVLQIFVTKYPAGMKRDFQKAVIFKLPDNYHFFPYTCLSYCLDLINDMFQSFDAVFSGGYKPINPIYQLLHCTLH